MDCKPSSTDRPMPVPRDPYWVTSNFSTKDLSGKRVRIVWSRGGEILDEGIYRMETGSYGYSRHIQRIRAVLEEGLGCGMAEVDLDQVDADQLHRSNEDLKRHAFVASLDLDRVREQSSHLEKLVRERRLRKVEDVAGTEHWETHIVEVLQPAPAPGLTSRLSDDLHVPGIPLK